MLYNELPIVVADDDFFDYMRQEGYDSSIEYDDFIVEYIEWERENRDYKWKRHYQFISATYDKKLLNNFCRFARKTNLMSFLLK